MLRNVPNQHTSQQNLLKLISSPILSSGVKLISYLYSQVIVFLLLTCFSIVLCGLATVMSGLAYTNGSWSYIGKEATNCNNKSAGKCACIHSVSVPTPFESEFFSVTSRETVLSFLFSFLVINSSLYNMYNKKHKVLTLKTSIVCIVLNFH